MNGSCSRVCTLAFVLIVAAMAGCGGGTDDVATAPRVVATTSQMADLVTAIGRGDVKVHALSPPLVNTHTWPPPSDAANSISGAKLVFRSGGDIDDWVEPVVKEAKSENKVIELSKSVKLLRSGKRFNSHWFTEIPNVKLAAKVVATKLSEINPAAKSSYDANLSTYLSRAQGMDDALSYCISLPKEKNLRVVAGHDDLDYLAKHYGFSVVAKLTKHGDETATKADVKRTARQARAGEAQVVTVPWNENGVQSGELAAKLELPKHSLLTDATSDRNLKAPTLLGSIAFSMNAIVAGATAGRSSCRSSIGG